jgi:2-phosphoglycerate kinase
MDRNTFWNVAQEALREVLIQYRKETSYETACANMFWQVVDNTSEWGIIFLTGRGGTGMFCIYVNNRLSEEETKLQFKTKLKNNIELFP